MAIKFSPNTAILSLLFGAICFITSCGKDDGPGSSNPSIATQTFSLDENSEKGTVVGRIIASSSEDLIFSIVSGNTDDAFSLSIDGELIVSNSLALNFEENETFELVIQVDDGKGGSARGAVIVSILDVQEEAPTDGLVAYYPFNGDANDESGNLNNGTVSGATLTSDRFGNPDSAYSFDGVNDRIDINNLAFELASTTTGSFSFWIKISDNKPSQPITFLSFGDSNMRSYINAYLWTDGLLRFAGVRNGSDQFLIMSHDSELVNDTWHHLVYIQDGVQPKIYLDGQIVSTFNYTNTDLTLWFSDVPTIDNATIGSLIQNNLIQWYHIGKFDDLRIYDRVLNESEISVLFQESNN